MSLKQSLIVATCVLSSMLLVSCQNSVNKVETPAEVVQQAPSLFTPEIAAQIDQRIENARAHVLAPGFAVGILEGQKIVYAKGFGTTTNDDKDPSKRDVTAKTLFRVATVWPSDALTEIHAPIVDTVDIRPFPTFELNDQAALLGLDDARISEWNMQWSSSFPGPDAVHPRGLDIDADNVEFSLREQADAPKSLWANIEGMLQFAAASSTGFTPGKLGQLDTLVYETAPGGCKVYIVKVPSKDVSIVVLGSHASNFLPIFSTTILDLLFDQNVTENLITAISNQDEMDREILHGGANRRIASPLDAASNSNLIGRYHHDTYGDIVIEKNDEGFLNALFAGTSSLIVNAGFYDSGMGKTLAKDSKEYRELDHNKIIEVDMDDSSIVFEVYGAEMSFSAPPLADKELTQNEDGVKISGLGTFKKVQ